MVGQNQATSDAGSISESITKESISGGNVGLATSDSPTFGEVIAESNILPTVVIDPSFKRFNGRSIKRSNVGRSTIREKIAVVNVTVASNYAYKTGGMKIDFTSISTSERFTQVYLCSPTHLSTVFYVLFVPDTNNLASNGYIKFFTTNGTEVTNGSTSLQGLTFKAYIRGV